MLFGLHNSQETYLTLFNPTYDDARHIQWLPLAIGYNYYWLCNAQLYCSCDLLLSIYIRSCESRMKITKVIYLLSNLI